MHGPLAIPVKTGKTPIPAVALITSLDSQSTFGIASLPLALLANCTRGRSLNCKSDPILPELQPCNP